MTGAKLPNVNILLPVEKTQIMSVGGEKTIDIAERWEQLLSEFKMKWYPSVVPFLPISQKSLDICGKNCEWATKLVKNSGWWTKALHVLLLGF